MAAKEDVGYFDPLIFCTNPGPGLPGTATTLLAILIAYAVLTNSVLVRLAKNLSFPFVINILNKE